MPSDIKSGKLSVKINLRINDESFLTRQAKLWYNASGEFESVMMDRIDDSNYSVVLANIPIDMTILYYFEILDKGGVWVKQLRNEAEQQTYEFSTGKDGIKEVTEWETEGLVKCSVCGYMCRPEWDNCPECNTPLHDEMMTQEVFIEDQKKKEEIRAKETDTDEIAWKEAQEVDEFWKGLPECPSCGYTVQEDWAKCPVCGAELNPSELKKKAVFDDVEADWDSMMGEEHEQLYDDTEKLKPAKEVKKEMEEEKKKKEKEQKDEWGSDSEDRDVL
jgi:RNA polymerase subunit RPABC4/transcription elongation factor Spt4